jgi:hypothetical protein
MSVPDELIQTLQIGTGVFWTLAYLLIIRRGFLDRTLGMPLPALAANLTWEFTFCFLLPHDSPQIYIDYVWFSFDLLILYQALRFGKQLVADFIPADWFYPVFALSLAAALGFNVTMSYEFQDWAGRYSAFGINVLMSLAFVLMLLHRKSLAGQSIYIAAAKMAGTMFPSALFFLVYPGSTLLNFSYATIVLLDATYLVLVYRQAVRSGINPWRRV